MSEYEFNEGDLVEAVKGEQVHRGRVEHFHSVPGSGFLPMVHLSLDLLASQEGWTVTVIEKAAPKLPDVPGIYTDRMGTTWRHYRGGSWYRLHDQAENAEDFAPFTKLEPVAETAKKVIEFIDGWWDFAPPVGAINALAAAVKQFGVTQ